MSRSSNRHIIFVGHDASLSGAPILLLNLLLLLQQENKFRITLVIRRADFFLPVYNRYFSTIVLKGVDYGKEKNILKRFKNIFINRVKVAKLLFCAATCDAIFSNTIVNGRLLKTLAVVGKPIITYVHELENVIDRYLLKGDSSYTLELSRIFAFPSDKVKRVLIEKYKIEATRLLPLSYFFPVSMEMLYDENAINVFSGAFKRRFKLNNSDFLVCGMGVAGKRKGADLFVEVCEKVVKRNSKIKFCWIGKFEDEATESELNKWITEKDIGENIVFTGVVDHHYYNLAPFNIFFLSSREDPYPLVVLEAAFMKVPALCFEPSGGITEFIDDDAGWIIPGYSIEDAAEMILHLSDKNELLREKGINAFKKSISLHSNKKLIIDQFDTLMSSVFDLKQ